MALQPAVAGPSDDRPRVAEVLKAFFDSVVIAEVCPQTAQVPSPSSGVCSGEALSMLEET